MLQFWNKAKAKAISTVIFPLASARGWRPGKGMPLDDLVLANDQGYDDETKIRAAIRKVRSNTMSSFERLATLWQQVTYLDKFGIEGALVECGVWKGGSTGMMALSHRENRGQAKRELHLFDSFEGLPEPGEFDGKKAEGYSGNRMGGKLERIDKCVGPIEDVKDLLFTRIGYPENLVHFHRGWFQDTINEKLSEPKKIALLRLDGDWYESTVICLKHLYPRVVSGGVVVIDDYGHWEGCKRATDEFIAELGHPVFLNHIDYTGRYWIKP